VQLLHEAVKNFLKYLASQWKMALVAIKWCPTQFKRSSLKDATERSTVVIASALGAEDPGLTPAKV
jgi:hypothetical protein